MDHPFDTAVALNSTEAGIFQGRTSARYANFIGPYGGITAAQCVRAIMQDPRRLGDPVAFTINYAAAVADGEFHIHARPARTNRSTQHWIVELRQADEVVATATAITALRRATWGAHEARMPDVPRPADVPRTTGTRVEWLQR
jgi:acyl-CoA thioesterase